MIENFSVSHPLGVVCLEFLYFKIDLGGSNFGDTRLGKQKGLGFFNWIFIYYNYLEVDLIKMISKSISKIINF